MRVYSLMGHSQPVCLCMSASRKACAPSCNDMWLGWEETPCASNVMMASMEAFGASLGEADLIFGAKADVRRFEMRSGAHVAVIESGKFLDFVSNIQMVTWGVVLVFDDENVIFATDTQMQATLY